MGFPRSGFHSPAHQRGQPGSAAGNTQSPQQSACALRAAQRTNPSRQNLCCAGRGTAHVVGARRNPAAGWPAKTATDLDESFDSDTAHGGGHVVALVVGPRLLGKSTTLYQHQSTLKTLMQALGLTTFPGAAGSAASINDFF